MNRIGTPVPDLEHAIRQPLCVTAKDSFLLMGLVEKPGPPARLELFIFEFYRGKPTPPEWVFGVMKEKDPIQAG